MSSKTWKGIFFVAEGGLLAAVLAQAGDSVELRAVVPGDGLQDVVVRAVLAVVVRRVQVEDVVREPVHQRDAVFVADLLTPSGGDDLQPFEAERPAGAGLDVLEKRAVDGGGVRHFVDGFDQAGEEVKILVI
jgi:hypothetical protein